MKQTVRTAGLAPIVRAAHVLAAAVVVALWSIARAEGLCGIPKVMPGRRRAGCEPGYPPLANPGSESGVSVQFSERMLWLARVRAAPWHGCEALACRGQANENRTLTPVLN